MRLLILISTSVFLLVACAGAPAPAVPGSPPPGQPTATAPSIPVATSAADPTVTAPSPPAPPPAPPAGGPVYGGDLAGALPRVVAGHELEITSASVADLSELSQSTVDLVEALDVAPQDLEIAIAHSDGAGVLIVATRLPGVHSATIDDTFIELQMADSATHNFRVESIAGRSIHVWESTIGSNWAWVNGDILFWMFGDEPDAQQAIAAMPLPTVALQPGGGQTQGKATVELVVAQGPGAGDYSGALTESGGCSRNAIGPGDFGFVSYDEEAMGDLVSVNLLIKDGAAALSGGTGDFVLDVEVYTGVETIALSLSPDSGRGSGTAGVQDTGQTATFQISGTTADGSRVALAINCNTVVDFGG